MSTLVLPTSEAKPVRANAVKTGRVLSGLAVAFLVFDAGMKFTNVPAVAEAMTQLGWPLRATTGIAILEILCLALYLIPRTSVLGVVLLTGYLGGAIATHVRVGNPLFSHVLFPVYIAALLWGGLYLRDARLRVLLALRSRPLPMTDD
ncbi:MAG TPA: DoxX family protein [Gemmatimonadaceae bacterium]|nr:DoxX family protein [Gemmatimonadaceae bacterium]